MLSQTIHTDFLYSALDGRLYQNTVWRFGKATTVHF